MAEGVRVSPEAERSDQGPRGEDGAPGWFPDSMHLSSGEGRGCARGPSSSLFRETTSLKRGIFLKDKVKRRTWNVAAIVFSFQLLCWETSHRFHPNPLSVTYISFLGAFRFLKKILFTYF